MFYNKQELCLVYLIFYNNFFLRISQIKPILFLKKCILFAYFCNFSWNNIKNKLKIRDGDR
jgi:hypothetical protein